MPPTHTSQSKYTYRSQRGFQSFSFSHLKNLIHPQFMPFHGYETMRTLSHNFNFAPQDSLFYKTSPSPTLPFFNVPLPIKNNQIFCNKAKSLRMDSSQGIQEQKIVIPNNHNEKLVGLLHETGSTEIVVLCHGFRSNKVNLF